MNRIKELTRLFAPSGSEQAIRDACRRYQNGFESFTDGCGNLIFRRSGLGRKIAYVCGMDEKGLFLTKQEKDGSFRYCPLGSFDTKLLDNRQVVFSGGAVGMVRGEFVTLLQGNAKPGESGIPVGEMTETESCLTSFGCVRSACCEVVLRLMSAPSLDDDVWFVFSAQYQMGKKGALAALSQMKPEFAFFVEGTCTEPNPDRTAVLPEKGPVVKLRDGAFMDVFSLADVLEDCVLPYQLYVSAKPEIPGKPGILFDVPMVIVGIPYQAERYFSQTIQKSAIEQTKELILELQERLKKAGR